MGGYTVIAAANRETVTTVGFLLVFHLYLTIFIPQPYECYSMFLHCDIKIRKIETIYVTA